MSRPAPGPVRFARNGAVRLALTDHGGTGGDPLLLVMGLAASRFWWPQGLLDALVDRGFHVVVYDQRDAGESTHLPGAPRRAPLATLFRRQPPAYSAEDLTDDAAAVLDAVGWDSAHLFGHSMGGLLAQRIALRHPGRVRSVTSSSALPSDAKGLGVLRYLRLGTPLRMARMRFPEGRDGDLALALAVGRALASPGYPFDADEVRDTVAREAARGIAGFRDQDAQSRQIGAKWHGGRLAELRMPALVLHGEGDQILRTAAGRRTAAAIPGARLVTFPGVGHFLPREVWPRYADEIRALADHAAGATATA
ncbi:MULTISPECIES: alpha/beta fold hydrolase [Streptomyces]|uniref:alpha/beta fold hydrolase n=1 Tax=Streptomyces TaxID=1883 RepID=UPI000B9E3326|nr:alpha/beta hydrolase [Streptomyces kasugaensis]